MTWTISIDPLDELAREVREAVRKSEVTIAEILKHTSASREDVTVISVLMSRMGDEPGFEDFDERAYRRLASAAGLELELVRTIVDAVNASVRELRDQGIVP